MKKILILNPTLYIQFTNLNLYLSLPCLKNDEETEVDEPEPRLKRRIIREVKIITARDDAERKIKEALAEALNNVSIDKDGEDIYDYSFIATNRKTGAVKYRKLNSDTQEETIFMYENDDKTITM